tara:strand:+ start:134 stop:307 length:174 start_codon:yes stop_codon:yes gene_type:complete
MTRREKGRKWDGRSRIPTDKYKNNWNDIFGGKKEDESSNNTSTNKRKSDTTGNRKES